MLTFINMNKMIEMNNTIQRGDCFKLLAACFYEPEKPLFLEENVGEKLGQLLDGQTLDGARAARAMQSALQEQSQEKLSIDYAALFVGPFELLAAPYGSIYIEKKRLVMGDSTVNTARYYQEADLEVDIKEPPDHIVIELEFMYYLCSKEVTAASSDLAAEAERFRDLQTRFFHNAMEPWLEQFCETIVKATDNMFYVHLSECLRCFIAVCRNVYTTPDEGHKKQEIQE